MSVKVNVSNFARAETDRMFSDLAALAGGVNRWTHNRRPTPLDRQPVIRMNRDTLYSVAIVDVTAGATVTLPDGGDRYVSVTVVDEDHYVDRILHRPGAHHLSADELGTPYVALAARILVDPDDPDDLAAVVALQDGLGLEAASARPFASPEYDATSLDATRAALLQLAAGMGTFSGAFGTEDAVDPVLHLLGTAAGWGGLPESEAVYVNVDPGLPVGRYHLRVADVPVDGFWSISCYGADGFFPVGDEPVSLNSVTATRDGDGAVTVHFGDWPADTPNRLRIDDGWNYLVRLYRPRPEVRDGTWTFPAITDG